jgi:hypothetical protein
MAKYKNQHIIPQTYLKQFGFLKKYKKEIWVVYAKNLETGKWNDYVIEKFLSQNHIYTLENYKEIHDLIIEKDLNGGIETRIPILIKQLLSGELNPNIHLAIAETTANFFSRANKLREWFKGWLGRDDFCEFIRFMLVFDEYNEEQKDRICNSYQTMSEKDAINSLMVSYMNYCSKLLRTASIEVLTSSEDNPFFTSDNPVALVGEHGYGGISMEGTQIYFPLSNKLLIRFYWHEKGESINRSIREITEEEWHYYHEEIIPQSADRFIISPIDGSLLGR